MSKYISNLNRVRRRIHKEFKDLNIKCNQLSEERIFRDGQYFLRYGTLELGRAFGLAEFGFLFVHEVIIDEETHICAKLESRFEAACREYVIPLKPYETEETRWEEPDNYSMPCGAIGSESDLKLDQSDPRGSEVFMMSEAKLKHELKTRWYKWLLYRTPYRPGKTAEYCGEPVPPRIE